MPSVGAPVLLTGTIKVFLTERDASVETGDGGRIYAVQAASCLLAPVIGDRVLICQESGEAFILAVLSRSETTRAEISVPDADHLSIKARREVVLEAPALHFGTRQLTVLAEKIFQTGATIVSHFKQMVETVGDKSINARTISTRAASRTASIDEADILNARSLIQTIDGVSTQTSEIALVTARRDVRLDGERVSVG
jgi:hypothetical protein